MNIIDDINIRRLDLTLLLVFGALLERRNMSAVAAEMGLTQSAVSHAVSRLRLIFEDPLFVRKGSGVEPTARALRLGPPLAEALSGIRHAMQLGRQFDPATATRRFAIAAPEMIVAALSKPVLAELAHAAPQCQVLFRALGHANAAATVAAGDADIAVGVFDDPPKDTIGTSVGHEVFGVASRPGHGRVAGDLDLDLYCALDHILVSHDRDPRGVVDAMLGDLGRQRRIAAVMPQMLLGFAAASQSDAIITAPLSACHYAASLFPLAIHRPPLSIPGFELTLLRHRDARADPAITWLADILTAALPPRHAAAFAP